MKVMFSYDLEKGYNNREYTDYCHRLLKEIFDTKRVFLTPSCTDALEMAALILDIRPYDNIVMPSWTFVSTANAFVLRHATPLFVDIREDTLNIDEEKIKDVMNPWVRAIVPVHYGGVGCNMDTIGEIAKESYWNPVVVEDNAQGFFGKYRGEFLGTIGSLGCHSYHHTKNFSSGEGGSLFVNDPDLVKRAEVIWGKGTNWMDFHRGIVGKYEWMSLGSSFTISDALAALLEGQFRNWQKIQNNRADIWHAYNTSLIGWARENGVRTPYIPKECEQSYHMYYLIMPTSEARKEFFERMYNKGIMTVPHYEPLHLSPMGKEFGYKEGQLPVTEKIAKTLVRLPFYNDMKFSDLEYVIDSILEVKL